MKEEKNKQFKDKGKPSSNSGKSPFHRNRRDVRKGGEKPLDDMGATATKPYVGPNDYEWRTSKELLALSAASLPFGNPIGLPMETQPGGAAVRNYTVPGIMAIATQITAGSATDYNSPCNLAGRQIYSIMRKSNSGSKNYDITDMTLYLLAYGQAVSLLGWLERIYHTITMFSNVNRYTPLALLKSQDIDATDVKDHQAELAFLISWFGNGLKSLNVPNLTYFKAARNAFAHYYTDDESPKHQFYLLTPKRFGVYNPAYDANGGALVYTQQVFSAGPLTFASLRSMAHNVLDVLLSDQDIGLISGDIAKAFTDLYEPIAFSAVEVCTPIYSVELLQQIHNCVLGSNYVSVYKQDAGSTGTGPFLKHDLGTISSYDIAKFQGMRLDAFSEKPSPEEVVNCTVLQVTSTTSTHTDITWDLYYPTDVRIMTDAMGVNYYDYDASDGLGQYFEAFASMGNADEYTPELLSSFDWHPYMSVCQVSGGVVTTRHLFGDKRNLRWFEPTVAVNIHTCSMLSLFNFNSL